MADHQLFIEKQCLFVNQNYTTQVSIQTNLMNDLGKQEIEIGILKQIQFEFSCPSDEQLLKKQCSASQNMCWTRDQKKYRYKKEEAPIFRTSFSSCGPNEDKLSNFQKLKRHAKRLETLNESKTQSRNFKQAQLKNFKQENSQLLSLRHTIYRYDRRNSSSDRKASIQKNSKPRYQSFVDFQPRPYTGKLFVPSKNMALIEKQRKLLRRIQTDRCQTDYDRAAPMIQLFQHINRLDNLMSHQINIDTFFELTSQPKIDSRIIVKPTKNKQNRPYSSIRGQKSNIISERPILVKSKRELQQQVLGVSMANGLSVSRMKLNNSRSRRRKSEGPSAT